MVSNVRKAVSSLGMYFGTTRARCTLQNCMMRLRVKGGMEPQAGSFSKLYCRDFDTVVISGSWRDDITERFPRKIYLEFDESNVP